MIDVCFSHFQIQFACSPNQADFVQVTKQERYGNESLDSVGSEGISSFLLVDWLGQSDLLVLQPIKPRKSRALHQSVRGSPT